MNLNERILELISKQEGLTKGQIALILDDVPREKIFPRLTILTEESIITKTSGVEPRYYLKDDIN